MNKLAQLINNLSEEDLMMIKRDLISGNIDRIISQKLDNSASQRYSEKICPICGGNIEDDSFVLEFGSSYLRRKAHFDGADCLEYFLNTRIKINVQEQD